MNTLSIKSVCYPLLRLGLLAGAALLVAGCEALTLDREPEVAHVELDSPDVSRLTLVVSQWFIEIEDPECEIPGDPGARGGSSSWRLTQLPCRCLSRIHILSTSGSNSMPRPSPTLPSTLPSP